MRIGLISDTHVPEAGRDLWPQVYEAFKGVDLILHAVEVLDWLEERCRAPVLAVRGNGDDGGGGRPLCPEDPRLKPVQVLDVDGFRIGMVHDFPLPEWPPHRTIEGLMQHFFRGPVDIVVAGDTHVPEILRLKGVLIVNSGSPVYPRNLERRLGTIGFLEIERGRVKAWTEQLK